MNDDAKTDDKHVDDTLYERAARALEATLKLWEADARLWPAADKTIKPLIVELREAQSAGGTSVAVPRELAERLDKLCMQCCPWSNLAAEAGDELAALLKAPAISPGGTREPGPGNWWAEAAALKCVDIAERVALETSSTQAGHPARTIVVRLREYAASLSGSAEPLAAMSPEGDGKDRHGNLTGWRAAVAKACGNLDPIDPAGVDQVVAAHVRHHVEGAAPSNEGAWWKTVREGEPVAWLVTDRDGRRSVALSQSAFSEDDKREFELRFDPLYAPSSEGAGTPTQRFDFLHMLDELEAGLRMPPKEGYDKRGATICLEDQCGAGAETETMWEIEQADIDMLRAALSAIAQRSDDQYDTEREYRWPSAETPNPRKPTDGKAQ